MSQQPLNLGSTCLRLRPDCSVEQLAVEAQFWPLFITPGKGTQHRPARGMAR